MDKTSSNSYDKGWQRDEMVDTFLDTREIQREDYEIIVNQYAPEVLDRLNEVYTAHGRMHLYLGDVRRAMLQKVEDEYDSSSGMTLNEYRTQQEEAFNLTIADLIAAEEINENEGRILRQKLSIALKEEDATKINQIINLSLDSLSSHVYDYDHGKLKAAYNFLGWPYPVHTWLS